MLKRKHRIDIERYNFYDVGLFSVKEWKAKKREVFLLFHLLFQVIDREKQKIKTKKRGEAYQG